MRASEENGHISFLLSNRDAPSTPCGHQVSFKSLEVNHRTPRSNHFSIEGRVGAWRASSFSQR